MAISFDENNKIFKLDTENTSYMMGISRDGYLGHLYYGNKMRHFCNTEIFRESEYPGPSANRGAKLNFLSVFPFEYPTGGVGDYRESCLNVINEKGQNGCELFYAGHRIESGKPGLEGLPASFGSEAEVDTLFVELRDTILSLSVTLCYSVFEQEDVITRSVQVENKGGETLFLDRVFSAAIDMDDCDYDMLTLQGAWARERHIQRQKLAYGKQGVGSVRGESSPQANPFLAVLDHNADQKMGNVYGMSFVYSGNFLAQVHKEQFSNIRMTMGIHPDGFCWKLAPGEVFTAPEVVMTFSGKGLGKMTRNYHDFFRRHLIRSPYKNIKRPILINNWEATYMDFEKERLLKIAKDAADCGVEMFVMDDGWFANRYDDERALGDWTVNEEKLSGTLKELVQAVKSYGMKFGIWMEPEMVSPDSELYRKHPDYAIQIGGRTPAQGRNQLVLDISRKEVRDTVYEMLYNVLKDADVDYIKWDMNRYLSDMGSAVLDREKQGELSHRYVLGLYDFQQRLLNDFPDLLLENCSAGGSRFDPGILYYSPQIWCSDDTDAIERLRIQEGTELVYPLSAMGAHVSKCPNEQVGRTTPFETRGNVALAGTFGYELDISRLTDEERKEIPIQIQKYHKFHFPIADGDYYRLHSWDDQEPWDCWENVSKDQSEALVIYVQVLGRPFTVSRFIKLEGLDPEAEYEMLVYQKSKVTSRGFFYGDQLMEAGIRLPALGDAESCLVYLKKRN